MRLSKALHTTAASRLEFLLTPPLMGLTARGTLKLTGLHTYAGRIRVWRRRRIIRGVGIRSVPPPVHDRSIYIEHGGLESKTPGETSHLDSVLHCLEYIGVPYDTY